MRLPARGRAWWVLLLLALLALGWILGVQPVLDQAGGWSGLGRAITARFVPTLPDSVGFELALDSTVVDVVRLREPGFRGIPADAVLDLGVVTQISGVAFELPPALSPASETDGQRAVTLTFMGHGRELGTARTRFDSLGTRIRVRPRGRLSQGEYDLRVAVASPDPLLPPVVLFYRLRAR